MSLGVSGFVFMTTSGKFIPLLLFIYPPTTTSVFILSFDIFLTTN